MEDLINIKNDKNLIREYLIIIFMIKLFRTTLTGKIENIVRSYLTNPVGNELS